MLQQRRLDLTQLQPVAADLHLLVLAAQVVQAAVAVEAGPVAAAEEPAGTGQGDEPRPVKGRIAQVARGDQLPADQQVARAVRWYRLIIVVDHPQPHVVDRPADRGAGRPAGRITVEALGTDHMGLGRTVVVEQPSPGQASEPPADAVGADQLLAGGDHLPQPRRVPAQPQAVLGEQLQRDVGQEEALDAGGVEVFQQCRQVLPQPGHGQVQGAAAAQRAEYLLKGDIKGEHRELQGRRPPRQATGSPLPAQQVDQQGVADIDALRRAGRAGGEQRVERPAGVPRGHRRGRLAQPHRMPQVCPAVDRLQGRLISGGQQHAERVELGQHLTQQRRRVRPVQRYGGQVEPGRGEQRDDVFHRWCEVEGDVVPACGRAVPRQLRGESGGVPVEVGVAESAVPGDQRGRTRVGGHLPRELLGDGRQVQCSAPTPAGLGQPRAVRAHQGGQRATPGLRLPGGAVVGCCPRGGRAGEGSRRGAGPRHAAAGPRHAAAGHRVQPSQEQFGHRGDVGGVEVVVGVLPEAVEAGLVRDDGEGERALRLGGGEPDRAGPATRQAQRGEVGVVQDEEQIEQRRVRAEVVVGDGMGQRDILRVEHRAHGGGLLDELRPQLLAGHQGQWQQDRVGEHPHAVGERAQRAVRHRSRHPQPGAAGHPVHGPGEDGQQQREAGQPERGTEPVERGPAARVDRSLE